MSETAPYSAPSSIGTATDAPVPVDYGLRPPPGSRGLPAFEEGWLTENGQRRPFIDYCDDRGLPMVNWSESLEEFHSRVGYHFMDVWTRRTMVAQLGPLGERPTILDAGCSSGFLLGDVRRRRPDATLIGLDLVESGLRRAHAALPGALLLRADVCELPLEDGVVDVILSANVLEHVSDDGRALAEIFRVLRPGGRAVVVVPIGPGSFNHFDRVLGHERRYARRELARKGEHAGLQVVDDSCLGALLYPAYRLVKLYNERRFGRRPMDQLERRIERDVERSGDSRAARLLCHVDEMLHDRGLRLPFGIRGLTVFTRPPVGRAS